MDAGSCRSSARASTVAARSGSFAGGPDDAAELGGHEPVVVEGAWFAAGDVDVEQACDDVGALHRAPHVEDVPREAAQHGCSCMSRT
jgi:hypothetical protein